MRTCKKKHLGVQLSYLGCSLKIYTGVESKYFEFNKRFATIGRKRRLDPGCELSERSHKVSQTFPMPLHSIYFISVCKDLAEQDFMHSTMSRTCLINKAAVIVIETPEFNT